MVTASLDALDASSGYLDGTPAGMQPPAAPQVARPATGPACHRPIDFVPNVKPRRVEETSTPSTATAAPATCKEKIKRGAKSKCLFECSLVSYQTALSKGRYCGRAKKTKVGGEPARCLYQKLCCDLLLYCSILTHSLPTNFCSSYISLSHWEWEPAPSTTRHEGAPGMVLKAMALRRGPVR